ncbi:MAG: aminotransferase class V-fold PLP-dependent enzyme [Cyanobacteria bacterium SZAS LIN-2]|nr:aminotransferase class V-fold PLP-dependent enzyme [Cyanobacteria bacterium SZAS LIN-2]
MKRIFVDMSVCLLHQGHVRLLQQAKELGGHVVVILTSDEEVLKYKGYPPELSFAERKEVLLGLKYVDEVIEGPWLIEDDFLVKHGADCLVHSGPNFNNVSNVELVSLERTEGVSSEEMRQRAVSSIVIGRNSKKCLLTPGPTNLHPQNLLDIEPVFSRSDSHYQEVTRRVLDAICALAGQDSIVAVPGSATTAIEVATSNFLTGRVLVVVSGYYSRRMLSMIEAKQDWLGLAPVASMTYEEYMAAAAAGSLKDKFDWVVCAYTETADAFALDMEAFAAAARAAGARLMVDATGSINLEDHHELADVNMFSSCKGLGGLTGAGFITYNRALLGSLNKTRQPFILDLATYIEKKTTSPAHTILSMDTISHTFAQQRERIRRSKQEFMRLFGDVLFRRTNQPLLCTKVKNAHIELPDWMIGYEPRSIEADCQVVCHLFDQFPSNREPGEVYGHLRRRAVEKS